MKSTNKAQLIGYLGMDPEIKQYRTGMFKANLRISTAAKTTEKDSTGKPVYRTTWHKVVVFGNDQVERLRRDYKKGSHVMIEGQIYYHAYADQGGGTHYATLISAYTIISLDRYSK